MELRRYRADLHIHTCLSPCGELSSSPRRVVRRAIEAGLDIIAVTDHNSAENTAAAVRAAAGTGLTVLPGMELTSSEEAHLLAIFGSLSDLRPAQAEVYRNLPAIPVRKSLVENQVVVNEDDDVIRFSRRCLLGATRLDVRAIVNLIHRWGGLVIASHIDKEAFSVVSQLGFIPSGLELDAIELSPRADLAAARATIPRDAAVPLVQFSDAHRPEDIGAAFTDLLLAGPTLREIGMAFRSEDGRRVGGS